ncbi:MAG: hypothetical protein OEM58_05200 [Nitrospirota bacterium]|nr:hypothetical protein [Nitrospirota bacterium]
MWKPPMTADEGYLITCLPWRLPCSKKSVAGSLSAKKPNGQRVVVKKIYADF